ncbi:ribbon-helix-helix domain-containing protein [Halovenus salina]|uniref:Ribbon-helix-helix protein, CopG family n=1 Tax=Halovenus salina TaxID=1510225 RepID=A0ABD5W164_9EURY|nr:ribbon-helix-helix domain-containing protein [Halovenus salina]
MSDADTNDSGGPEKTNINIRVTETLLDDIDATWADEGFNNRSEFIREALRDAVRHPELTRESWKEIAAVEHARRTGESETFSRDELLSDDE